MLCQLNFNFEERKEKISALNIAFGNDPSKGGLNLDLRPIKKGTTRVLISNNTTT